MTEPPFPISRLSLDLQSSFPSHTRRQSSTFLYSLPSNESITGSPQLDHAPYKNSSNQSLNTHIPSASERNIATPSNAACINPESNIKTQSESASITYRGQDSLPTPSETSNGKQDHQKRDQSVLGNSSQKHSSTPKNLKDSIIKFKLDDSTAPTPKKRKTEEGSSPEKADRASVSVAIGARLLKIDSNDSISFFSDASNALMVEGRFWQQQGPISYVGLTKTDPFIKLVRNFTTDLFKSEQFSKYVSRKRKKNNLSVPTSASSSSLNYTDTSMSEKQNNGLSGIREEETSQSSADEEEGDIFEEDALIVTKIKADSSKEGDEDLSGQASKPVMLLPGIPSLHSLHSLKSVYYSFVEDCILLVLPRKTAISTAILMYFRYVHPFIPIFHENTLLEEIAPLFRSSMKDKPYHTSVSIKSENQRNLAGILLLVIRLGYMTLIPNLDTEVKFSKKEQDLIKDITRFKSDHYMGIVELCIPEEKVKTKSTFKYVQCLCLLFFYRSVAPNDCLGLSGADSQLLFGAIVNHALSIGLNRDPTQYKLIKSIRKNETKVKIWRNLWSYIVITDSENAIYCGTPLKIPNLYISDVKLPAYDEVDPEERLYFEKIEDVHACYRRITDIVTNLQSQPKVVDVLSETSYLESKFLDIFGENFFRDYVCIPAKKSTNINPSDQGFLKVDKFLKFISLRVNLSCFYYLIILHYELKVDNNIETDMGAGIELFKIFIKSAIQVVYIMTYALDNSQELFGRYFDWILTSRIERSMIKTHSFATSVFIRVINLKRTLACQLSSNGDTMAQDAKTSQARVDVIDNLFGIAITEAELFVGNFRALSKTHINSYRLYVMAYFALKQCMENPEHILKGFNGQSQLFFHDGTNLLQFLSLEELRSMSELCEEFRLAKIDLLRRKSSHNSSDNQQSQNIEAEVKNDILKSEQENPGYSKFDETPMSLTTTEADNLDPFLEDDLDSMAEDFDALLANRAMYANENTVNTYGLLQPRHMDAKFQKEVFDSQSMIGNDELFKLFEMYGEMD